MDKNRREEDGKKQKFRLSYISGQLSFSLNFDTKRFYLIFANLLKKKNRFGSSVGRAIHF